MNPSLYEKILVNLMFKDEEIRDRIIPFLRIELFDSDFGTQNIIKDILAFSEKYDRFPSEVEMKSYIKDAETSKLFFDCLSMPKEEYETDFMMEEIADFFKRKLLWNDADTLIKTLKGPDISNIGEIPNNIMDSLAFSFDTGIGLDFFTDPERLFDSISATEKVVPSGIKSIDNLIEGGFHEKSLSLFLAGCVTKDTKVRIRYKELQESLNGYDDYYDEVEISEVHKLMSNGTTVEVDTPTGYSKVVRYVEKGTKKLFGVKCDDRYIKVSYDHLFETCDGWVMTCNLNPLIHTILCKDGKFHSIEVNDIEDCEEVVDLEVESEYHKYYTEDMVSHNTNVGKTLIMCSLATNMIMKGYDVLYVTFEDSEEKIANRIMFNLLDADKSQLKAMSKERFMKRFAAVKDLVKNKLIIKEFPEYACSANHLRQLLKDLKVKKKFTPRAMFIDYIGCMIPNGKQNINLNSNDLLRFVAGQTRAVGMEFAIPIISGAQTNRAGSTASEIDMTDTADSFGQTMKADVIFGVTETAELAAAGLFTFYLLKSRYGLKGMKISVGVDKFKQRLFGIDGDEPKLKDLVDDAVVATKTPNKMIKNIEFQ